jgi:ribosome-associated protein
MTSGGRATRSGDVVTTKSDKVKAALDDARVAREALEAKKGSDIVLLDVRGISSITDFVLIASGNSGPQLKAMTTAVQQALKAKGSPPYRRSGSSDSGWMVLDYFDLVIHMFSPEAREYYAVEELWEPAPRLD